MRRYDFELESSHKEKDRAYMHDSQKGIPALVLGMHPPGDKVSSTVGSHPVRGGMRRMIIVET